MIILTPVIQLCFSKTGEGARDPKRATKKNEFARKTPDAQHIYVVQLTRGKKEENDTSNIV